MLALKATAANERDRAQEGDLARALQEATDGSVKLVYGDQGCHSQPKRFDVCIKS